MQLRPALGLRRLPQCRRRGLASLRPAVSLFSPLDKFPERHIGPDDREAAVMLEKMGYDSMDAFIGEAIPAKIRVSSSIVSDASIPALSESELHARAKYLGSRNKPFKSYIGMGYHAAVVPPVILRNVRLFFFCHLETKIDIVRSWKILSGTRHTLHINPRSRKDASSLLSIFKRWLPH